MGLIKTIDHVLTKAIFSIFWWFIDPLEQERLYGQLVDVMERNIDANNPDKIVAPDNFDVLVNNTVFIKHAPLIKKLESTTQERLQKYVANKDYELPQPRLKIQIISSATVSKHKADIRCWFSSEQSEIEPKTGKKKTLLKIIAGQGKGKSWDLKPGNTYKIGRISSAQICLPYENISKNQATLYFMSESKITIVDEGSTNGTFINNEEEPLKGSRELKIGNKIKFCKLDPIIMALSAE
ncbi:MAG: FHA domain-containing protein [bacterium]